MLERDVAPGIHRVDDALVNWYLVEDDSGVLVIDTGFPRSWDKLQDALVALDRTHDEVRGVVLTHAHYDHVGFAERARRELGWRILCTEEEVWLAQHPYRFKWERLPWLYVRHPSFLKTMARFTTALAPLVKGVEELETFKPGTTLRLPGEPRVIPTPGHTLGHVSLHFPDRDCLVVGDAVCTFNPYTGRVGPHLISRAATADSRVALRSLDAIAETGARILLPGHGDPWTGGAREAARLAREVGIT